MFPNILINNKDVRIGYNGKRRDLESKKISSWGGKNPTV